MIQLSDSMDTEEASLQMQEAARRFRKIAETHKNDRYGADLSALALAEILDKLSEELMNFHILWDK